ncbi:hypothetical protein ACNKHW_16535 [Shigella flexneri]
MGKTELCKAVNFMFDSDEAMVRIDMSEFMGEDLGVLFGWCASGYVGY